MKMTVSSSRQNSVNVHIHCDVLYNIVDGQVASTVVNVAVGHANGKSFW